MTLPALTEMQLAIGGALRLAIGDRAGLGSFDTSLEGFWRSFRAALVCYPLYLFLLLLRVTTAQWQHSGAAIFVVETIAYVIGWVAFPLLILPLARAIGREERFLAFMVVYNWSQILQTALFAIVGVEATIGLLGAASVPLAELVATIAIVVYEWYIARVTLAATMAQAALVVVLDLMLAGTLGRVAEALY